MKSFKFYVEIDADTEDQARDELIKQMEAYPLIDMPVEEIKPQWDEKTSVEDVLKCFDMEDKYDFMNKIDKMYEDWDGYSCKVCGDTVPCDSKELVLHMTLHTIEEIKEYKIE